MTNTLKIAIVCTFGLICGTIIFGAGAGMWLTAEDLKVQPVETITLTPIDTPPTPKIDIIKCNDEFQIGEVREFEEVSMRFMSYTFDMSGKIERDDGFYYIVAEGWDGDGNVYAIVVNEVIYDEDFCFIIIQKGCGGVEHDYEISDKKLKEIISKSKPIES